MATEEEPCQPPRSRCPVNNRGNPTASGQSPSQQLETRTPRHPSVDPPGTPGTTRPTPDIPGITMDKPRRDDEGQATATMTMAKAASRQALAGPTPGVTTNPAPPRRASENHRRFRTQKPVTCVRGDPPELTRGHPALRRLRRPFDKRANEAHGEMKGYS